MNNMEIITESPEHHFLTKVERLKSNAGGYVAMHFDIMKQIKHAEVISNIVGIKQCLASYVMRADALIDLTKPLLQAFSAVTIYRFSDTSIGIVAKAKDMNEREALKVMLGKISQERKIDPSLCYFYDVEKDFYAFQKLTDQKFLTARLMSAYETMADVNKVSSICARRNKREDISVLVVEDDRFTAAFALNVLNKKYETHITKTGEEAILSYIEHAPDIVFMDLHLPGLNGHITLNALHEIDPEAHVIMLSVDAVKDNIVNTYKCGAAGFLKKPIAQDRLLATVEKSPFTKKKKSEYKTSAPDELVY